MNKLTIQENLLATTALRLELLTNEHREELRIIAKEPQIWQFLPIKAHDDKFDFWFDKSLKHANDQQQIPFVVRDLNTNKLLGTTRFYDLDLDNKKTCIGYTWYTSSVWSTYVNPLCKYLLLQYAFETFKLNRVEFMIDARNLRSQAAVKKLGAKQEGFLRKHLILDNGFVRDTVVFSIISDEWPQVKDKLAERVKGFLA